MFRGINTVNLDQKGRMALPSRYRARISDASSGQMVVTIDTEETCLLLYPSTEWESIEKKLQALPSFNRAARRIQRLLIGHATDVELDGQGRLLLPSLLREYAALEKKVVLIGQGNKFELWSERNWQLGRDAWLATKALNGMELPPEMEDLAL